jgi:light-regulated signal transduction histidine kinase (bacteriophytochrome)
MRILIAEDEPSFRHLLEEILVKWGYDVIVARDGNEAWQALRANNSAPQLAILDWLMPGMDGVDVCRKVRKEVQEPYTYIILLTSQNRDEDMVTGMEAGADDYVTKPLKVDELRVRINAGKRMIELQNELAVHAAELEAANRDLESFSYTVSNDLLKSLMAIGDYARAILDFSCDKNDEQCRNYAKRIYDRTRHLGETIGIMHDFFRPMRIDLYRETVDLSEMAASTAEKLRMTKPERRVTFRIADGIKVEADRSLLQTALNNLLDNAWKHTGKCEDAVIEFGLREVEGIPACFVRDNGTGFDMAYADRLFRPFRPLPGTEELATEGVGLATVERIIRRHGGRVWAEGAPGMGATFWFTVPGREGKDE